MFKRFRDIAREWLDRTFEMKVYDRQPTIVPSSIAFNQSAIVHLRGAIGNSMISDQWFAIDNSWTHNFDPDALLLK